MYLSNLQSKPSCHTESKAFLSLWNRCKVCLWLYEWRIYQRRYGQLYDDLTWRQFELCVRYCGPLQIFSVDYWGRHWKVFLGSYLCIAPIICWVLFVSRFEYGCYYTLAQTLWKVSTGDDMVKQFADCRLQSAPNPKYYFRKNANLELFQKRLNIFSQHLKFFQATVQPEIWYAYEIWCLMTELVRGMGLFSIWRHKLFCMHVHKESMPCKWVCDVNQE